MPDKPPPSIVIVRVGRDDLARQVAALLRVLAAPDPRNTNARMGASHASAECEKGEYPSAEGGDGRYVVTF